MNSVEWQREAESVIASADLEDVRVAIIARLEERYGVGTGLLPLATGNINFLTQPLLGVTATDAQCLAALKHLHELREQCSWARQYFEATVKIRYRGPRAFTRFVDKLLRTTRSCLTIAAKAKPVELRVGASLDQRISSKSTSPGSSPAPPNDQWRRQGETSDCVDHAHI